MWAPVLLAVLVVLLLPAMQGTTVVRSLRGLRYMPMSTARALRCLLTTYPRPVLRRRAQESSQDGSTRQSSSLYWQPAQTTSWALGAAANGCRRSAPLPHGPTSVTARQRRGHVHSDAQRRTHAREHLRWRRQPGTICAFYSCGAAEYRLVAREERGSCGATQQHHLQARRPVSLADLTTELAL